MRKHGLPTDAELIVSISRLVPRKGFDTAIRAVAKLAPSRPDLVLAIAGRGRDRARLERLVDELGAPVRFLGRVPNDELPALYGCADLFTMLCRNRWGGLEQEGFGIVFVEAAACGVPQVAGDSGGAAEAVADGETGLVMRQPEDVDAAAAAFESLLDDDTRRASMATASRARAIEEFSYDRLAARLGEALGVGVADQPSRNQTTGCADFGLGAPGTGRRVPWPRPGTTTPVRAGPAVGTRPRRLNRTPSVVSSRAASRVSLETRICPPCATALMRAAVWTGIPM